MSRAKNLANFQTTITDGTTSVATSFVTNGCAKAWVNFNGTGTIATRDSINVSSLNDDGTGKYDVVLTSAMDNANYAVNTDGFYDTGDGNGQNTISQRRIAITTTQFGIRGINPGVPSFADFNTVNGAINGDLA